VLARGSLRLPETPPVHSRPAPRVLSCSLAAVPSNFNVAVHGEDRAVVIEVSGELDLASSPALEHELEQRVDSGPGTVVVDLRQLEFMDSTGLSVLVRAHQRAIESDRTFAIVKGPPQVQRLLDLTGVAERLNIVDSPEELLGSD